MHCSFIHEFGIQNSLWFWDSNCNHGENLGCKMFFSFVIHCSCIPFVLMILGFNFHSHLHIYVFMIEFWDANMLMIMGFNFNVDLHMSDYMFWFWDSKLDVILGFNFVMFFGWNLLLFKLNVWFIKWYDGHGHVFIFLDYGHILIDACFLFFLSSWMYIMAMFYLGFACFFLLWPLLECSCNSYWDDICFMIMLHVSYYGLY